MDVIVIGGGAAGCMAAISAGKAGCNVTLIEKNEKLGKKIYITGKGRCNVTNDCDTEDLFKNINKNPKFLYSAIYCFDNNFTKAFFEANGCPLKTERGERVFPVSDHASDIIKALNKGLRDNGVKVLLNTRVTEILSDGAKVTGVSLADKSVLKADKIIIATGGLSYPATGSTGDGYKFAKALGHTIIEPEGSLVPIVTGETWVPRLQGLSLKNVELRLLSDGKQVYKDLGEMMFTHFGITGPLVLSASAFYIGEQKKNKNLNIFLDLKPGLSKEQLDKRVLRDFDENKNRQFKNSLDALLPSKLIPVIIELSGINPLKPVNEVSKEERTALVALLKNLELTPIGTSKIDEAIITRGGVSVKEINASTMESKLIKGLFFAGEVIDVDAMTGGFNLQIAWSTGHLAGSS